MESNPQQQGARPLCHLERFLKHLVRQILDPVSKNLANRLGLAERTTRDADSDRHAASQGIQDETVFAQRHVLMTAAVEFKSQWGGSLADEVKRIRTGEPWSA